MLKPRSAESLRQFCEMIIKTGDRGERSDPIEAVQDLIEQINYEAWLRDQSDNPVVAERRIENTRELVAWLSRLQEDSPGQGLTDLMGRLSLLTSLDQDKDAGQEVRLMTLHGSKGLEFPHVFLVGVEEELLPHRNSLEENAEEEERRLMYVGITRARESLSLSFAKNRRRYGEMIACEPSRFLNELPKELVEWRGEDLEKDHERTKERASAHLDKLREMFSCILLACLVGFSPAARSDVPQSQAAEVEHLIRYLENSDCEMVRNGKAYSGEDGARHVRRKYSYFRDEISTTEDFIEYSATKSTMSDEYYKVICPGAAPVKSEDWLQHELKAFRQR